MKLASSTFFNYVSLAFLLGLVIFSGLYIKRGKQTIHSLSLKNQKIEQNLYELKHQMELLNQVLQVNLEFNLVSETKKFEFLQDNQSNILLLNLKQGACTDCLRPLVSWLFGEYIEKHNFFVYSHLSNKFFLKQIEPTVDIDNHPRIFFYPKEDKDRLLLPNYDSEVIFLKSNGEVALVIPLEYIRISGLLNRLSMLLQNVSF